MTLNVPREYESLLSEAVASGAFADPESALRHALELLADEQHEWPKPRPSEDSSSWAARFRAWAASHPRIEHFVDDSRESIYEGRGL
jgi:Arc/MetJ-type ribon-helix-helix transcriptional regulator